MMHDIHAVVNSPDRQEDPQEPDHTQPEYRSPALSVPVGNTRRRANVGRQPATNPASREKGGGSIVSTVTTNSSTVTVAPGTAPADQAANGKSLSTVDTDVHHGFRKPEDLHPYLSRLHRERLDDFGLLGGGLYLDNGGSQGRRADTLDPDDSEDSGTSALDARRAQRQLLDGASVDIALLTGGQTYTASAMTDLDYASALCRAFNDFSIEHWLAVDDRFRLAIAICTQDPQGAVQEIERLGDRPDVVAVLMPCGALRPFGHRFYHPIYEACVRHNLTVALHFGAEGIGVNPAPTPAGYPSYYIESRFARPAAYQVHLASFIFEGVFVRFPSLRVAILEAGFGWVPSYLWRMDADWKGLRYQTPWVDRLPSEYVDEHVTFASQPMEDPPNAADLAAVITAMNGERNLMFASDHPHWDWDDPNEVFRGLPAGLRQRIMVDNALEAFPKLVR